LLDDPDLVQTEIDRRREAARQANPLRKREEELRREQARLEKSIERLINAYQEGLVTLPQLRHRTPELRRQMQAVESELHSLEMAAVDEARYLQLAETLATFRGKLRARAETLDVRERQQILRLLVKEILVDSATIIIRHSLPVPPSGSGPGRTSPPSSGMLGAQSSSGYPLRSGSHHRTLGSAYSRFRPFAVLRDSCLQPFLDQTKSTSVGHAVLDKLHHPLVIHMIEEPSNVCVQHPFHSLPMKSHTQRV
jgi:site-specific DNA recombinase